MYKALKENKIIAISDEDKYFHCLVCDEIVEDKEHTVSEYGEYNGEYMLISDIPHPTNEEQKEARAKAYQQEVDVITAHIQRLRDENPVPEDEIEKLIAERDAKVEEIKERFPYYEN